MLPLTILTTHTHTLLQQQQPRIKRGLKNSYFGHYFSKSREKKQKSRIFVIFSCFEMCENLKKKFANFYGTKSCYFFWRSPRSFSIVTGVQSTKKLFFAGSKQLLGTIKRCCTVLFFFRIFMGKATFIVYWHAIEALSSKLGHWHLGHVWPSSFSPKIRSKSANFLFGHVLLLKEKNILILLTSFPLSLLNFMKIKKEEKILRSSLGL